MPITYPDTFSDIGAELQALRTLEAAWEYNRKVDGSTYVRDKINLAYSNSTQSEEIAETASKTSLDEDVLPNLAAAHEARLAAFEGYFLKDYLGIALLGLDEDEATEPISYIYNDALLANGQVQILQRTGPWGQLRSNMVTNVQTIQKPTSLSAAAIVADSDNVGSLVESGVTVNDHTLPGTINIECVDDTIGATKFSVKLVFTNLLINGDTERSADNDATLAKAYEDGQTGLFITLGYGTLVESGDGGNIFSATAVATPGENDGAKGKYYFRVVRMSGTGGNPDFRVYWYRADTRLPEDLVATADFTGTTGTAALSMVGAESTITSTFSKANAATALPSVNNEDNDIIFDIDNPRVGDKWTKAITNNESGNFASKIARRYPASLNSVNPTPSIADSLAASLSMS